MLSLPVHRRGFGLMFQDFALFPHKDVAANVAFGLRMRGLPPADTERRVQEVLDLVGLGALAHRDVHQLSGGEQQRVALARSLAPSPRLLMLDEPMGSLDRTLRDRLLEELRQILRNVAVTVLYVTHDQGEAFAISDRVILMRQGQVIQAAPPEIVYRRPSNAWAARFLGMRNLLSGKRVAPGVAQTEIGQLLVEGDQTDDLIILIRPEAATLERTAGGTSIECTLLSTSFRGTMVHITVQCPSGRKLFFDLPSVTRLPPVGEPIALTLRREAAVCLSG
jgi:ABC-type Fe3+/spermidine/putrescine transport system ATPase subunit